MCVRLSVNEYICTIFAQIPTEASRGCWITYNWRYKFVRCPVWMLTTESGFSARAASTLLHSLSNPNQDSINSQRSICVFFPKDLELRHAWSKCLRVLGKCQRTWKWPFFNIYFVSVRWGGVCGCQRRIGSLLLSCWFQEPNSGHGA